MLSVRIPWELGYTQAIGKKIYVLPLEVVSNTPACLGIYDNARMEDNDFLLKSNDDTKTLINWIEQ